MTQEHRASLAEIQGCAPSGLHLPTEVWQEIAEAYGAPHRHYHNLIHLVHCAGHFQRLDGAHAWHSPVDVFLALLFHDIVYDPSSRENEALSARWAHRRLSELKVDGVDAVVRFIELTAIHGQLTSEGLTSDEQLFLDVDMSILGSPPDAYAEYEKNIFAEYAPFVPEPLFRSGRLAFLQGLSGSQIFLSPDFQTRYEAQAQANIQWAIEQLSH